MITERQTKSLIKAIDKFNADRRRLNKAWHIFKSDNPDWELEHDTEDED